jgi:hypothetical protein
MKLHIDPAQLNELLPAAKERLRAWWKPQEGDWWFYDQEAQRRSVSSRRSGLWLLPAAASPSA